MVSGVRYVFRSFFHSLIRGLPSRFRIFFFISQKINNTWLRVWHLALTGDHTTSTKARLIGYHNRVIGTGVKSSSHVRAIDGTEGGTGWPGMSRVAKVAMAKRVLVSVND